jgi:hypothetical protein
MSALVRMIERMFYFGKHPFQRTFHILVFPDADHSPSRIGERGVGESVSFDIPP